MAVGVTTHIAVEHKGTNPDAIIAWFRKLDKLFPSRSIEESNVTKLISLKDETDHDYYTEDNIVEPSGGSYVEYVDEDSVNLYSTYEPPWNTVDFVAEQIAKVSEHTIIVVYYDCDFIKHGVRIYDGELCDTDDDAYEWTHEDIFKLVKSEHNIDVDGDFLEIEDQLLEGMIIDDYDDKYWAVLHAAREKFTHEAVATIKNGHDDG